MKLIIVLIMYSMNPVSGSMERTQITMPNMAVCVQLLQIAVRQNTIIRAECRSVEERGA